MVMENQEMVMEKSCSVGTLHIEILQQAHVCLCVFNSGCFVLDISNSLCIQYPRIDTQQLDRQIKSIMTEVIPVLKEHMDEVCSQHLLQVKTCNYHNLRQILFFQG